VKTKKHAGQLHYDYILDKHVLPAVGDKRLRDVTHDDVQSLINLKRDSGLSSQTVIHIRNVINRVFKYARTKGAFYGELPTMDIEMAERVTKEAHAMDFKMAVGLLEGLEPISLSAYGIVLLALTSSMNIAELLGLRRKRVNLSKDPIMLGDRSLARESIAVRENFYRGVFGTVKQKSRNRDLPLPRVVLPVLQHLMEESPFNDPESLVFATEKGTPLDEKNLMRRIIKPIAVRLGMPWMGWHVFRHTHSTLAEELGMALSDRQAQMGHGDFRMTMHYTHSDLDRRRQTLDVMADRLTGKPKEVSETANLALNDTKEQPVIAASY
jgi:integrase